jgi:hypothetical protein
MSAQAFNRIAALEAELKALKERVERLELQACEKGSTLTLRKPKAEPSHA